MKRQPREIIDYRTWTQEQFEEEMRTNPKFVAFFEPYSEASVTEVIREHAKEKVKYFADIDDWRKKYEENSTYYFEIAENYLNAILQKKLFNLQCLWRAGKINLPFVKVTSDFEYFSKDISACPFIEPITEEELDLAMRFLTVEKNWGNFVYEEPSWQDYDSFSLGIDVDVDDDDYYDELPDLYEYFDTYMNTGSLRSLPDVRGEIENKYEELANREMREENRNRVKPDSNAKPNLYFGSDVREKFIETCENTDVKELYALREAYYHETYESEQAEIAYYFLNNIDEEIPIEAHKDWRVAIVESMRLYKQKKIAENLPFVYDNYLMSFEDDDPKIAVEKRVAAYDITDRDENDFMYDHLSKSILKARKMLGEPVSLDYLDDV